MRLDKLNGEIKICRKCRLSETRIHVLCGEGNQQATLMLIAQAPGEREDREGKMFIGPSGKVLDELLTAADINRENVYLTNLLKCMLPKYRKPKQDEIEVCSKYLDKEIEIIKPRILVPLGYYATKYLFVKYAIPLPSKPEVSLVYGKLFLTADKKILPVEHPAAVLYKSTNKKRLIDHYCKIKVLLTDCKWYPVCPMKRFYEERKLDKKWIELYCKGDWKICTRYHLEEKGTPHPDWMLPDGSLDDTLPKSGL